MANSPQVFVYSSTFTSYPIFKHSNNISFIAGVGNIDPGGPLFCRV